MLIFSAAAAQGALQIWRFKCYRANKTGFQFWSIQGQAKIKHSLLLQYVDIHERMRYRDVGA